MIRINKKVSIDSVVMALINSESAYEMFKDKYEEEERYYYALFQEDEEEMRSFLASMPLIMKERFKRVYSILFDVVNNPTEKKRLFMERVLKRSFKEVYYFVKNKRLITAEQFMLFLIRSNAIGNDDVAIDEMRLIVFTANLLRKEIQLDLETSQLLDRYISDVSLLSLYGEKMTIPETKRGIVIEKYKEIGWPEFKGKKRASLFLQYLYDQVLGNSPEEIQKGASKYPTVLLEVISVIGMYPDAFTTCAYFEQEELMEIVYHWVMLCRKTATKEEEAKRYLLYAMVIMYVLVKNIQLTRDMYEEIAVEELRFKVQDQAVELEQARLSLEAEGKALQLKLRQLEEEVAKRDRLLELRNKQALEEEVKQNALLKQNEQLQAKLADYEDVIATLQARNEQVIDVDQLESIEDVKRRLSNRKLAVIGGDKWIKNMAAHIPEWIYSDNTLVNKRSLDHIANCEAVMVNVSFLAHTTVYKLKSELSIPVIYLAGHDNIELTLREIDKKI